MLRSLEISPSEATNAREQVWLGARPVAIASTALLSAAPRVDLGALLGWARLSATARVHLASTALRRQTLTSTVRAATPVCTALRAVVHPGWSTKVISPLAAHKAASILGRRSAPRARIVLEEYE